MDGHNYGKFCHSPELLMLVSMPLGEKLVEIGLILWSTTFRTTANDTKTRLRAACRPRCGQTVELTRPLCSQCACKAAPLYRPAAYPVPVMSGWQRGRPFRCRASA